MRSITINSYDCLLLLLLTMCGAMGRCEFTDPGRSETSVCINIYECEPVMQLIHDAEKSLTPTMQQHIKSFHCGFDGNVPKVWCEQQTVRTGETESEHPPDVSSHVNLRLINSGLCGSAWKRARSMDLPIYGGNGTGIFEYPWMALLAYRTGAIMNFWCGGTVINERYILTTAECILNPPGIIETVRVGEHNINTERDCIIDELGHESICAEEYQDIDIANIHPHPEFVTKNIANNIALVRLSRDIDFTPRNVKPICLPVGSAAIPITEKVTVTGWGTTEENGTLSDALLQLKVSQVSNEDCAKIYKPQTHISYKQLCAGGGFGGDVCSRTEGGPLQGLARYHNTTKFVQYGIGSFGLTHCAPSRYPGVYTNVVYYMDWILNTIIP